MNAPLLWHRAFHALWIVAVRFAHWLTFLAEEHRTRHWREIERRKGNGR